MELLDCYFFNQKEKVFLLVCSQYSLILFNFLYPRAGHWSDLCHLHLLSTWCTGVEGFVRMFLWCLISSVLLAALIPQHPTTAPLGWGSSPSSCLGLKPSCFMVSTWAHKSRWSWIKASVRSTGSFAVFTEPCNDLDVSWRFMCICRAHGSRSELGPRHYQGIIASPDVFGGLLWSRRHC